MEEEGGVSETNEMSRVEARERRERIEQNEEQAVVGTVVKRDVVLQNRSREGESARVRVVGRRGRKGTHSKVAQVQSSDLDRPR